MLEVLRIRNLALIEDMELEFAPGMNVLSGETGAGKSFILRAIDFLTGERMSSDLVRPGADKAVVEALFVLEGGETILRRELSADTGRSRLYVDDRLGSQETVRELRPGLVIHTSQHGQQKLLQPAYQAAILDEFLPDRTLVREKERLQAELRGILERKSELLERSRSLQETREFLEHQRDEIAKIDPQPGEEDELLVMRRQHTEREQAGECLQGALDILAGDVALTDVLGELGRQLDRVAALFPDFEADRAAVEEFRHHMDGLHHRLRRNPGDFDDAPEMSLDDIESRLFELAKLKRKLNRSLEEIVDLHREIEDNLSFLDSCTLDLKQLEAEEAATAKKLGAALETLNAARREAAVGFCRRIEHELHQLGFSEHARVEFSFTPQEVYSGPAGALHEDRGRLQWIPNPGQPARPLDKIASGGELSRFLLALVGLRAATEASPTLIFDEVDAGIGGLTLNKVGEKLAGLAARQQMILITHWPQLAGLADRHFLIRKDVQEGATYTRCGRLEGSDIREELARMAGGGDQGEALAGQLLAERARRNAPA